MSIADLVRDGKKTTFMFFKENELWYKTEDGFEYPIHFSETQGGIFLNEDKAIFHMRFIRPHFKMLQEAKAEATL
jgi:hypothetical protein